MCVSAAPLHALHQCHFVRGRGDVKGGGLALVNAMLDPIYRLLLFYLHRVAQTQSPEEQLLTLLCQMTNTVLLCDEDKHTHAQGETRGCAHPGFGTGRCVDHVHSGSAGHHLEIITEHCGHRLSVKSEQNNNNNLTCPLQIASGT